MEVTAKVKVVKAEINLDRNNVYVEVNFVVKNMTSARNQAIITLPLTDQLREYIEDIITTEIVQMTLQEPEEEVSIF